MTPAILTALGWLAVALPFAILAGLWLRARGTGR
jgi:hypothetical protein